MPLARSDLNRGRSTADIALIADAIHYAIVDAYWIPLRDRFQIVTQHEIGAIIARDSGLGSNVAAAW